MLTQQRRHLDRRLDGQQVPDVGQYDEPSVADAVSDLCEILGADDLVVRAADDEHRDPHLTEAVAYVVRLQRRAHLSCAGVCCTVPARLIGDPCAGRQQHRTVDPGGRVDEQLEPDSAADSDAGVAELAAVLATLVEDVVDDRDNTTREVGHGERLLGDPGVVPVAGEVPGDHVEVLGEVGGAGDPRTRCRRTESRSEDKDRQKRPARTRQPDRGDAGEGVAHLIRMPDHGLARRRPPAPGFAARPNRVRRHRSRTGGPRRSPSRMMGVRCLSSRRLTRGSDSPCPSSFQPPAQENP